MRTIATALAVLAAASLTVPTAFGAPWQVDSYTINPGTFHSATQFSESGEYALTVECHEETGRFEVLVESPFDWDLDASYAPDVPAILAIDGAQTSDVSFFFDERQLVEGIVGGPEGQSVAFERLLATLSGARDSVTFSYFDRTASFSAEGLGDAMLALRSACM